MTNEKKQEFTLRITQANKSQLIVLLYEIFLQYMEDAKDALADGQKDAFHRSMEKSIDCLRELTDSVQEKNELGRTVLPSSFFSCTLSVSSRRQSMDFSMLL